MGVTPNTFLNILMQQNTKEKNYLLMTDKMLLPPTYAPPESTQGTIHILRKQILWHFGLENLNLCDFQDYPYKAYKLSNFEILNFKAIFSH